MKIISDLEKQKIIRNLEELNPGRDAKGLAESFIKKQKKTALAVLLAITALGVIMMILEYTDDSIGEGGRIDRNSYRGSEIRLPVTVRNATYGDKETEIRISSRVHTDEEIEDIFKYEKKKLLSEVRNENEDLQNIYSDLYLPASDEEYGVEFSYLSSMYSIIDDKGIVKNEDLSQKEEVVISVTMSLEGKEEKFDIPVAVCPKDYSDEERFFLNVEDEIVKADEKGKTEDHLMLPDTVKGEPVLYAEKKDNTYMMLLLMGCVAAYLTLKGAEKDLEKKCEERKKQLLFQYPTFVSKLAVLIGAGMNISSAIKRIQAEGEKSGDSPLTEELGIYVRNVRNGVLEDKALHDLGQRCGISEYRRFTAVLSANAKKGSMNLKTVLEEEAEEAFSEHQARVRKLGEEAGTKLLLPMVMMLMVVMVIVMVPAFMTYQI